MQNVTQFPQRITRKSSTEPLQSILQTEESPDGWDKDLPRTVNPYTGKDDTEERKAQCEEAYKVYHYTSKATVAALRRGLYLSIVAMRNSCALGGRGYLLDNKVVRRSVRQPILQ